jgi:putative CocE/NonD family hydrolase
MGDELLNWFGKNACDIEDEATKMFNPLFQSSEKHSNSIPEKEPYINPEEEIAENSMSWVESISARVVKFFLNLEDPALFDQIGKRNLEMNTVEFTSEIPNAKLKLTHYYPKGRATVRMPTILIRTPYDRSAFSFIGSTFAERGYHVIIQECRNTFAKENQSFPLNCEASDGLATVLWIEKQNFFDGNIGMFGMSYLGMTQYAIIDKLSEYDIRSVKCLAPINSTNAIFDFIYPNNVLHLDLLLIWLQFMIQIHKTHEASALQKLIQGLTASSSAKQAFNYSPLNNADSFVFGEKIDFIQEVLLHPEKSHKFWGKEGKMISKFSELENSPPIAIFCGWYDCFFRNSIEDYLELSKFKDPSEIRLTIGPWTHWQVLQQLEVGFKESLIWFDIHLKGNRNENDDRWSRPVKVFIMGIDKWILLKEFPPEKSENTFDTFLSISEKRMLEIHTNVKQEKSKNAKTISENDLVSFRKEGFLYDPRDPTPSIGGSSFNPSNSGGLDQREIENRKDILTFTSQNLETSLCILGFVEATIIVRSSSPFDNIVCRLCDVHPDGKSVIICDGLTRLQDSQVIFDASEEQANQDFKFSNAIETKIYRVEIKMSATGTVFQKGHQIRIHIAAAAHPRWMRTFGTKDAFSTHVKDSNPSYIEILFSPCSFERRGLVSYFQSGVKLPCVEESFINDQDWIILE